MKVGGKKLRIPSRFYSLTSFVCAMGLFDTDFPIFHPLYAEDMTFETVEIEDDDLNLVLQLYVTLKKAKRRSDLEISIA